MNKKRTYTFRTPNIYFGVFAFVFVILNHTAYSQQKDSSALQLNEVTIIDNKQQNIQNSKKTINLDTFILKNYQNSSLGELLSQQSTIHIKTYGNGNIASTSIRGGNSSQTAVLWNGLNIQNPRLGMSDLSILPTLVFDNVALEYGGGSALWGSGAMGGSIHLSNKPIFENTFKTNLSVSYGSFGLKKISTGLNLSNSKISSTTKIYYSSATNNYQYKDTTDKKNPVKEIKHGEYNQKGVIQELGFKINTKQSVNIRFWYNNTNRNIPSYTENVSKQNQADKNLKLNADWNYHRNKLQSTIRFGYFKDILEFNDSISKSYNKNYANTLITESDNIYNYNQHQFNFGANFTSYNSYSYFNDSATATNTLNKLALFAAYKVFLLNNKLNLSAAARKEFTSLTPIPKTGNVGGKYQLNKFFSLKANGSSSYRQPTLDDLYWPKSGNPNLKPEESYEFDGSIVANWLKKNTSLTFEGTYFNRHTRNWIIWLPVAGGANFSPRNINEVYSRGTETNIEWLYVKNNFRSKLIINTAYVLATNLKSKNENDNSIDRQLIYTPRYTGQCTYILTYKEISILINQTYTGYRFTSTDNTSWLNPYYLCNIRANYSYLHKNTKYNFFGNINNVFNQNYMIVSNRPMPLRNFEVGLSINYYKPKTKNKT